MSGTSARLSLPQKHHLKRRRDFEEVYTRGRRIAGQLATLWALPREGERTRLGLVASRRVGGATARNRAKRLMREAFRLRQPALSGAYDIVISARGNCARARWCQVEAEIARQLARAGCLGGRRSDQRDETDRGRGGLHEGTRQYRRGRSRRQQRGAQSQYGEQGTHTRRMSGEGAPRGPRPGAGS